jgi:hypothetical protein
LRRTRSAAPLRGLQKRNDWQAIQGWPHKLNDDQEKDIIEMILAGARNLKCLQKRKVLDGIEKRSRTDGCTTFCCDIRTKLRMPRFILKKTLASESPAFSWTNILPVSNIKLLRSILDLSTILMKWDALIGKSEDHTMHLSLRRSKTVEYIFP